MAARGGGRWKEGQNIEIYNQTQKKWIFAQICDIRKGDDQNIYSVKHGEWVMQIAEKDASSVMRMAKSNKKSKYSNARKAFIELSKNISDQFPVSRQIRILTDNSRARNDSQRTFYELYFNQHFSISNVILCVSSTQTRAVHVAQCG